MGFLLDGEELYKKGKDQILLRCVDFSEASKIVKEFMKEFAEHMPMDIEWLDKSWEWAIIG